MCSMLHGVGCNCLDWYRLDYVSTTSSMRVLFPLAPGRQEPMSRSFFRSCCKTWSSLVPSSLSSSSPSRELSIWHCGGRSGGQMWPTALMLQQERQRLSWPASISTLMRLRKWLETVFCAQHGAAHMHGGAKCFPMPIASRPNCTMMIIQAIIMACSSGCNYIGGVGHVLCIWLLQFCFMLPMQRILQCPLRWFKSDDWRRDNRWSVLWPTRIWVGHCRCNYTSSSMI